MPCCRLPRRRLWCVVIGTLDQLTRTTRSAGDPRRTGWHATACQLHRVAATVPARAHDRAAERHAVQPRRRRARLSRQLRRGRAALHPLDPRAAHVVLPLCELRPAVSCRTETAALEALARGRPGGSPIEVSGYTSVAVSACDTRIEALERLAALRGKRCVNPTWRQGSRRHDAAGHHNGSVTVA